jgi:hypothetical protein
MQNTEPNVFEHVAAFGRVYRAQLKAPLPQASARWADDAAEVQTGSNRAVGE